MAGKMLTTSATYRLITRDIDRSLQRTLAEPSVKLETRYYLDHIGAVKNVDDLIKDHRLFTYAMKAFGLGEMANARAFMRKVIAEGTTDPRSFANRLADDRFVEFAKTFNFQAYGETTTASVPVQQGVVDRYVRQTLETEAGAENEGVRLALYFQREAPHVKSVYGLLADPALWQVTKTAFGFPDEMASAPIEQQAAAVLDRMSIDDLSDPASLDRLIARFTAVWDATESSVQDPILTLFTQSQSRSINLDLIVTLNSLKHGGP
jgi:hypothetical protein